MAGGKHSLPAQTKKKKRSNGAGVPIVVAVLLLIAVAAVVKMLFFAPALNDYDGEVLEGQEITVTVPEGAAASQIAETLVQEQVISSSAAFLDAVEEAQAADQLKPGTYKIVGGEDLDKIVQVLVAGRTGYTLTIPEGYTISQIAAAVETTCDISSAEFETLAHTAKDYEVEFSFLEDAYQGSMEGFLYPSTYEVPFDATASDVIKLMLQAYQDQTADVSLKYAKKKNLTRYDVLTLASIIEKESRSDKDKKKIASVFYNRLKAGMALGSDVTTYYAVGKELTEELTEADLASDSPYNTRNEANKGLPPSPICSPGAASIAAAAHPDETKYLYFFYSSKKDKVMFYKNLQDFNAAWAKYQ